MRNDGAALFVTEAGYSRFSTDYGTLELSNAGIIGTKTINWPDASGTVALTSDIINPTLDNVLTNGDTSLLNANIGILGLWDNANGGYSTIEVSDNSFSLKNTSADFILRAEQGILSLHQTSSITGNFTTYNITGSRNYELPDKSGIIALTSDIPSIPTLTSQLTNDGADGANPFITALDIPTSGQAGSLVREVKNMTGATLTKGTVVYISGANGNKALVSKAQANAESSSARTFGLLQSDILNNGLGNCVIIGDLSGLNTSAFTEGAQLYLSGTVAGAYTDVKTLAPTHLVYIGKITRSHPTLGQIEVAIQNGYELDEIHDVSIISKTNNDIIQYDSATSLWKNRSLSNAGIQPTLTPAALTKVNDTNVTLTLGGTPSTSLLQNVSLTLGWTGTLADSRIASATIWNAKQDAITGAATTITTSNLTASRVLVSDASGKVSANTITTTTLSYLDATSSIQTQLNAKQGSLTLTTIGSSGAATLIGNTLNIPQYSGGGGGGVTPVKLTSQTLLSASWVLVSGYYTYTFNNVNVTTTCDVSVTPQNASYLTAYNAQVLPYVGVAAGVATFYSNFPPQANMIVDIVITQTT